MRSLIPNSSGGVLRGAHDPQPHDVAALLPTTAQDGRHLATALAEGVSVLVRSFTPGDEADTLAKIAEDRGGGGYFIRSR